MSISSDVFSAGYVKTKQDYVKFQSTLYKLSNTSLAIGNYMLPSKLAWLYFDLFEKYEHDDTEHNIINVDGTVVSETFNINQLTPDEYSTCFAYLSKIVGSMTNLKF